MLSSKQSEAEVLSAYPPSVRVDPLKLIARAFTPGQFLIVIDDDPTGSQTVAGIPVLTAWSEEDLEWAFAQRQPAIFVLTNSRSVDEATAIALIEDVVSTVLRVAGLHGFELTFLSRSDSILRGHFPAETDAISRVASLEGAPSFDGVVLVPAFPSAGRVTVGGTHYLREGSDLLPVAQTQFAQDASFGYRHSDLREYVEEKTRGAVKSDDVMLVALDTIRSGTDSVVGQLDQVRDGQIVVVDCVTDDDLRALCLGLLAAELRGKRFLYRTGPSFVGARIGQTAPTPLEADEALSDKSSRLPGGLVVVGSHVDVTNRQLAALCASRPDVLNIELPTWINQKARKNEAVDFLADAVDAVVERLEFGDVVIRTSREVETGDGPESSLRIATAISALLSSLVRGIASQVRPRFIIAKGGITSHDIASKALDITRATVVGPLLPGIVSLWRPVSGLATNVPYVVFPGNVGDDDALLAVVNKLSAHAEPRQVI